MTIRAGCIACGNTSCSTYKIDGHYAAGIAITGFGTKPIPAAVCDNAVETVTNYAAQWIQKVIDAMLEHRITNMDYAKRVLKVQLEKLSASIIQISQKFGQGIYIAGSICYVAEESFVCLPFGGGIAFLWDGTKIREIGVQDIAENNKYITDALGGANTIAFRFDSGFLPVSSQLFLASTQVHHTHLREVLSGLAAADPSYVANTIAARSNMYGNNLAIVALSQHSISANEEGATNDH